MQTNFRAMLPNKLLLINNHSQDPRRRSSCRDTKPKSHGKQTSRPHQNRPSITPSEPPCLSSSVAYHPSFGYHFHLALLLLPLFLRRQRTGPSLASSTRAAFRIGSCFQRSDLAAWAQAVVSLAVFACRYAGCGGRAGRPARQDPRSRRPRWRILTMYRGSWSVQGCRSGPRVIVRTRVLQSLCGMTGLER
jgi:hypothetical protein